MIDHDRPVRVFKNLTHGCYSIMQGARIVASARQVLMADVELRVRESGRRRMLALKKRNVHAYVVGRLVDFVAPGDTREVGAVDGRGAVYRPYETSTFVDRETGAAVRHARSVRLDDRGVTYAGAADEALPLAA